LCHSSCLKKLRDNVTGDLSEDFRTYAARWGRSYALYLLCWEFAGLCIHRFGPTPIVMGIGAWFRQKLGLSAQSAGRVIEAGRSLAP
jgi:hypothetical protein